MQGTTSSFLFIGKIFMGLILALVIVLLWGTHMVTSGIQRGFGGRLRAMLTLASGRPWRAIGMGAMVTILMQSSTATGLMAATFAADGVLPLGAGLLVMLGANLGTALVACLLAFPVADVAGIPMLLGYLMFRRARADRWRQGGRAMMGLGMMLLALHGLSILLAQAGQTPAAQVVTHGLTADPLLMAILAALAAWAGHSSIATVLALSAMQAGHPWMLPPVIDAIMGLNVGAALAPWLETATPQARRLPLGNLLVRCAGAGVVLATQPAWAPWLVNIHASPEGVVLIHLAFNIALLPLGWAGNRRLAGWLVRWIPDPPPTDDPGLPRFLDSAIQQEGHLALAAATRETLRVVDMVRELALRAWNTTLGLEAAGGSTAARVVARNSNRLTQSVRIYLDAVPVDGMGEDDANRMTRLVGWLDDLDRAADMAATWVEQARKAVIDEADRAAMAEWQPRWLAVFTAATDVLVREDREHALILRASKQEWRQREESWRQQRRQRGVPPTAQDPVLRALGNIRLLVGALSGLAWRLLNLHPAHESHLDGSETADPVTTSTDAGGDAMADK